MAEIYQAFSPYNYVLNNPIKNIDPDGRFVGTLIGTVVGGVVGAVDAYRSGKDVLAGATEGAVAGAIAGAIVDVTVATGGGAAVVIAAASAGGALGNAVGDVAGQVVTNLRSNEGNLGKAVSNINFENTGKKALTGAAAGFVGGSGGVVASKALGVVSNSTKAVQSAMSKNITVTGNTLNKMGANAQTTQIALDKITQGMGNAGRNTANNIAMAEAGTTMIIESGIKVVDDVQNKNNSKY